MVRRTLLENLEICRTKNTLVDVRFRRSSNPLSGRLSTVECIHYSVRTFDSCISLSLSLFLSQPPLSFSVCLFLSLYPSVSV